MKHLNNLDFVSAESTSMTRKKRSANQTPLLFGLIKNVEKQLNNDEKKVVSTLFR